MTNYELFIAQLDDFINRFYRNRIFKGILISLALLLLFFLLLVVLEYFMFITVFWRTIWFWVYILSALSMIYFNVVVVLLKRYGIFKRMSYRDAARHLSKSYPELDDKLYNVLELKQIENSTSTLVEEAIEQISSGFSAYKFAKIISFKSILKYIKFLSIPILFILLLAVFFPKVLTRPSHRLVHYNQVFEKEFPFDIFLMDSILKIPYEEDFVVNIRVEGDILPSDIQIVYDNKIMECKNVDPNSFSYSFSRLRSDVSFYLKSGDYMTKNYTIEVIPRPLIRYMKMDLDYPSYTQEEDIIVENSLDAVVPYGTKIKWVIDIDNADNLLVLDYPKVEDGANNEKTIFSNLILSSAENGRFSFTNECKSSFDYAIVPLANTMGRKDTLVYGIEVIPDRYPKIDVKAIAASSGSKVDTGNVYAAESNNLLLKGYVSDDYGFYSLVFRLRQISAEGKEEIVYTDTLFSTKAGENISVKDFAVSRSGKFKIEFDKNKRSAVFVYALTPELWNLKAGQEVSYDFEIRDNDPFAGYKHSFSTSFFYKKLSEEEKLKKWQENRENLESAIKSATRQNKDMDKAYQSLSKSLLENSKWNWEEKQKVEKTILDQHNALEEKKRLAEEMKEKALQENQWNEYSEKIKEKENILEELMKDLWDEKNLKTLEEIQKLLEENAPKEKVLENIEKWKEEQRDLAKDWERNKEMYKMLEFEKSLEKAIDDLKKLREDQDDLKAEIEKREGEKDLSEMLEKQEELNARYEEIRKNLSDIDKQNSALTKPTSFKSPQELMQQIKDQMQQAADKMSGGNINQAQENQEKAAESMKQLEDNLQEQQQSIEEETQAEDSEFIRLLLKETIRVSVEEENLMSLLQKIRVSDPSYPDIIRRQNQVVKDVSLIADSINAIAIRQPIIASVTRKEVKSMLSQSRSVLSALLSMNDVLYQRYQMQNQAAVTAQQRTMMSLNNLALLLSESLDNMQMSNNSKGGASKSKGKPNSSCSNPGDGKPKEKGSEKPSSKDGAESIKQRQESLNKGLEALKKALESKTASSEGFMRLAAEQEMIRRALQKQLEDLKKQSGKAGGDLNKVLGDMEQTEKELVNRNISAQTLLRQQRIQTRLLEAEKAEMQREIEEKRESEEGKIFSPQSIEEWDMSEENKEKGREVLNQKSYKLKPYYKRKVEEYFN